MENRIFFVHVNFKNGQFAFLNSANIWQDTGIKVKGFLKSIKCFGRLQFVFVSYNKAVEFENLFTEKFSARPIINL